MKRSYILLICLGFLSTCQYRAEKRALQAKIDSLEIENQQLSSGQLKMTMTVEEYRLALGEINKNLASIDETKALVRSLSPETGQQDAPVIESIQQHMINIGALLENSRLKIVALDKHLEKLGKDSADKNKELLALDTKLKEMAERFLKKEMEMYDLEEELRAQISNMQIIMDEQLKKSHQLEALLNRAFYIKGTSKELRELGIIKQEGGFIGLGRVKVLNASAPSTLFEQVKKDQTLSIVLSCKKAKLITSHPEDSYTFQGDSLIDRLYIRDPSFWRNTNYLVIEVDKEVGPGKDDDVYPAL